MGKIKIGIDFHGVISAAPELFAEFCHEIRRYGIQVYIISGGPEKDVADYLQKKAIEYDRIWAILDFYEQKGKAERFEDGSFKVDTTLWNKAKAKYCASEDIRFHIDDSNVYGKYFITPYCRYDMADTVCEWNGIKVDFRNARQAAKKVYQLISRS